MIRLTNEIINKKIPIVYITPYEHHSNILPWVEAGCYIEVADSDSNGIIDLDKFEKLLESNLKYEY